MLQCKGQLWEWSEAMQEHRLTPKATHRLERANIKGYGYYVQSTKREFKHSDLLPNHIYSLDSTSWQCIQGNPHSSNPLPNHYSLVQTPNLHSKPTQFPLIHIPTNPFAIVQLTSTHGPPRFTFRARNNSWS